MNTITDTQGNVYVGSGRTIWNSSGSWIMVIGAVLAIADCIFNYLWPNNGINGTAGALGVIGGAVFILVLALWAALALVGPLWWRGIIRLLLLLAIIIEAFCAVMLETPVLQALMAFTALGWFIALFQPGAPRRTARPEKAS